MHQPTWTAQQVTPAHILRAAGVLRDTLNPVASLDWSITAGPLTWTCRQTLDHISDALVFYCGQLAGQRSEGFRRIRNSDPRASISDLITAVETGSYMLGAIANGVGPDARGWHRMGISDPEGFLAMACEEILIHTWDIAQGFGVAMVVPDDLAAAVLARIFPWAPTECTAWEAQLWCSDRIALPGRDKIGKWGWHGTPISEWDGSPASAVLFTG
jgi:hypothetical protein